MKYLCDDGNAEIEIEADSAREAAQEYVDGGDWGNANETVWITVYVRQPDDDDDEYPQRYTITLDPPEPNCVEGESHDWQSPYTLLGGCKENPGVWGNGGGVIITSVCSHCGTARSTDTWAQDPQTGEQGLTSISYDEGKYADQLDPGCGSGSDHDWQYPHSLVGGCDENPGVFGDGGDIVTVAVCMICGTERTRNSSDGSASYEANKYSQADLAEAS